MGSIDGFLQKEEVETEKVLEIVYQPQAVFKVRAVTRCTSTIPGKVALPYETQSQLLSYVLKKNDIGIYQWFSTGVPWSPRVPLAQSKGSARSYTSAKINSIFSLSCADM